VIVVLLPWVIVSIGCWVGFQLLRQNGRMLLRLEQVERQLATLAHAARERQNAGHNGTPQPAGLTPGVPAPAFELPDLSGVRSSLAQFRGRPVLLIFFSPQCVFCVQMAPELSALPFADAALPLPVVVTTGDAAANRRFFAEHEIRCPVLLQPQMEVAAEYQAQGTPMGYLIDAQGRIASALTIGAQGLLELARKNAPDAAGSPRTHGGNRTLADSRLVRDGLKAGTRAPEFRLPTLDGAEIALSDYEGKRVLVVFSDPHCGPCEQVATALQARYSAAHDPQLLIVSRGERADNLAKISQLGLTFPFVLQKQWEISKAYGMFATPIGYLIDERGVISRDVAVGAGAILALYGDPDPLDAREPVTAIAGDRAVPTT
jgi:peroxiredoxin